MLPELIVPALNLEDAYLALDPRQPVRREELNRLFVERPGSPTARLKAMLTLQRRQPNGPKILFVGHLGSGKTSELTCLAAQLEDEFISVQVPAYDIFRKPELTHTELIYAMNLRLLQAATREGLFPRGVVPTVWEKLLEDAYIRLKRGLVGEKPVPPDESRSVTVKVAVLAAELETKIGTEDTTRRHIAEQYAGNVNDLIQQIDDVAAAMRQFTGKSTLILVDGLEKFELHDTKLLFVDHSKSLTAPSPSILYTFPIGLQYKGDFNLIRQSFDSVETLPNFSVTHRDGSRDEEGRAKLADIIKRRVNDDLLEKDALEAALASSGGHVKTLIQMLRLATLEAIVSRSRVVSVDHLETGIRELRDSYMKMLSREDREVLSRVRDDPVKDLAGAEGDFQRLLYNGSLLEYGNTRGPWINVNPIVGQLLEVFEQSLETSGQEPTAT
jgi:tRNA A37 threonylcarbamoyladenosine biosynthesis protein TsaE